MKNKIELTFEEIKIEVAFKVKKALKLLNEANELAKEKQKNLYDFEQNCIIDIQSSMEEFGWNTSSWNC